MPANIGQSATLSLIWSVFSGIRGIFWNTVSTRLQVVDSALALQPLQVGAASLPDDAITLGAADTRYGRSGMIKVSSTPGTVGTFTSAVQIPAGATIVSSHTISSATPFVGDTVKLGYAGALEAFQTSAFATPGALAGGTDTLQNSIMLGDPAVAQSVVLTIAGPATPLAQVVAYVEWAIAVG